MLNVILKEKNMELKCNFGCIYLSLHIFQMLVYMNSALTFLCVTITYTKNHQNAQIDVLFKYVE